ncbi:Fanconi anemia group D2 protein isoform X2 [Anthonomus grandis grandis]|uniref:Fanconi anemia group D2 protein isoform X2 n=1 Tax=Anthonomus grandis grandis TaxID=2921223 RepID=UPI002164FEDA|nr:Fanconi anemia group D2 protein isoform X2 [Anthonomus grandis grandis]
MLEILEAIPEILPDNQCELAAKQLTKLLDENEQLCGPIIDCLTALHVESDIKTEIHDRIMARIMAGVSLKVYLILIKFLISDYKSQAVPTMLLKIRNSLDNIVGNSSRGKDSDKTLIFHYLQTSAVTQRVVAEQWLTLISNIKVSADHKPIDLLIIFMLHHTSELRKKAVEMVFRKRVSSGLFKLSLLEKMFDKYMTQQLLKDYVTNIIKIGCSLLRFSKDSIVAKFATFMFDCLFNHPYTGAVYRGEILSNLICLIGSNDHCTINTVLKLILLLVEKEPHKVQTHIPILMQMLEKLESLEFKDVKLAFDILCSVLCGANAEDSLSGFKDQIFNTVRKELSCSDRTIKHRGIISAIVMVKHIAAGESDQSDDVSFIDKSTSVRNLPRGPAREAVELLELVSCATGDTPELLCLYYDQLASILASDLVFNKYFLYWLYKKVEDHFQSIFITSSVPEPNEDLRFSIQYMLNRPEEINDIAAINIASYTISKDRKILLLAPYFRVLRLLHFRQHEHLSEIDALLGCGVILPDVEDVDDLDPTQIKYVVDCLFYCANWFREVISAFVSQKDLKIQERVVKRLQNLIEVEKKMVEYLKHVSGHNLPLSYFDSLHNVSKQLAIKSDKPAKPPKKKFKSAAVVNETQNNTTATTSQDLSRSVATSSKKAAQHQSQHIQLRQLDTDLIRLIKYPLNINASREQSGKITLNLCQIKFILDDFVNKLAILTQNKDVGLSHLNDVKPEYLIRDCAVIVRYVNNFLEIIVKQINKLLQEEEDAQYHEEATNIKICFGSILETYRLIFQWSGFQEPGNVDLLRNILKHTGDSGSTQNSVNRLIVEFINKLSGFSVNCLHLNHAVSLIKIMETLYSLTLPNKDLQKKICCTAETLLSRRWYDFSGKLDQGQMCNRNIDVLIKAYFKDTKMNSISKLVSIILEDIASLEPKDGNLTQLPAIDHKNFHVFYLGLCNALLSALKTEIQTLTNKDHIVLWDSITDTVTSLKIIAKELKNRSNLSCFLKKTICILKVFLTQGIPIIELVMKRYPREVQKILKSVQATMTFLHNLCCQSKITRDASVVAHIPSFKHTIESIIYRVKAALVANDCSAAFWLGNLKNRDMDGEDIASQSTVISSVRNEGREEIDNDQLPSDDDDDDEHIIDEEVSERAGGDSESMESEVFG